jgi:hypothetical protein
LDPSFVHNLLSGLIRENHGRVRRHISAEQSLPVEKLTSSNGVIQYNFQLPVVPLGFTAANLSRNNSGRQVYFAFTLDMNAYARNGTCRMGLAASTARI